jgi:hypothetical protein
MRVVFPSTAVPTELIRFMSPSATGPGKATAIRILIADADDHTVVREGLVIILALLSWFMAGRPNRPDSSQDLARDLALTRYVISGCRRLRRCVHFVGKGRVFATA